jgi:hypothetical protein
VSLLTRCQIAAISSQGSAAGQHGHDSKCIQVVLIKLIKRDYTHAGNMIAPAPELNNAGVEHVTFAPLRELAASNAPEVGGIMRDMLWQLSSNAGQGGAYALDVSVSLM